MAPFEMLLNSNDIALAQLPPGIYNILRPLIIPHFMSVPALVGGTVIKEDLVPSIVFAILYGSLVPLAAFRFLRKDSRTSLLIGPALFSVERLVVFSLRAAQARNEAMAQSLALISYEQLTIGMGYINTSRDLSNFLRVLLVNTTKRDPDDEAQIMKTADQPRRRFWYRRLTDFLNLAFISAIVPAAIAGGNIARSINDSVVAGHIMRLRYVGSGIALFLTITISIIAFATSWKIRSVPKSRAYILVTVCCLLSMVSIYRLVVMHNTVDSLLSRGPGSLSSPTAKALFYIFHMVPEWLVVAILLGLDTRKVFETGPFGDWRGIDPKEREIAPTVVETV